MFTLRKVGFPSLLIFVFLFTPLTHAQMVAQAQKVMVVTAEQKASEAALDVLKRGGNAVDAAIAAQWVLNVVEPHSSGIGGGGFFLFYDVKTNTVHSFDGREEAPGAAHPEMFLDASGVPFTYWPSRISGGLPVGVPGTLKLLKTVHEKFGSGKLTFSQLFEPAIQIADEGFPVSERLAAFIEGEKARLGLFPASAALFLDSDGNALKAGTPLVQRDLAETFRLIAQKGIDVFYEGAIAKDIVSAVMNAPFHPGLMRSQDLVNYQVVERVPIRGTYRGYEIFGMGPPSSGGITVQETLNILEYFTFSGIQEAQRISLFAQAQRLAFIDRNLYLGDGDWVKIPYERLLSKEYAQTLSDRVEIDSAGVSKAVSPMDKEGLHTTHISIVDAEGNMVSFTTTIEHMFGSGMMVPGRGFFLNNELTDFDAVPAHEDGTLKANAPGSNKRPRSSMSPTLVFKDGEPVMILGSPGGSRIIGTVLNLLFNVIDRGLPLEEAMAEPRVLNRDGILELESPLPAREDLVTRLQEWGFEIKETPVVGNAQAIVFTPDGIVGVSDPRGDGQAWGY